MVALLLVLVLVMVMVVLLLLRTLPVGGSVVEVGIA